MVSHVDTPPIFTSASRIKSIGVSEILRITQLAGELKSQGRDIISLGIGEPDFDTPDHVKDAARHAISIGATKYTSLGGTRELKAAIKEKMWRDNALDYSLSEIIVSAGAKEAMFSAMLATLDDQDEVIIPAPYWTSYAGMVSITGAKPVIVPCPEQRGFFLSAEDLDAAITGHTRWIILNSPGNPTGAVYSRDDYLRLLEVLDRNPQVWILADDIYEHIIYDSIEFATPAMVRPELKDRTLTVNGVSKAYAMTGWRIGYGCGPEPLIKAMLAVQSQNTACPCSVSQAAAISALTGPQDIVRERCSIFESRRNLVVDRLNSIEGISCLAPGGSFYVFANCEALVGCETEKKETISSDIDFAEFLLMYANVAVIPGTAFGMSPFFRLSFAASNEKLENACQRINQACAMLI